ncbi:related to Endo-1,4-beta-xylanase [Ramularia collo-cygni]|uniref:Beta-xylanase n=1 Tax=Ramularia collo-cygni TaxID=112498 RepID=A0A2D3UXS1_9PEZI|nr:related to Endo-1,4-beta-xylanase [Ramularia collo-cygni]CZT15946.1 related to Endo-1,4-beta-xylanase [Ramularia collo-cygni]
MDRQQSHSLHASLTSHGKLYWGVATDAKNLSNPTTTTLITTNFNQLTPENSLKWSSLQPTRGSFTFSTADSIIAFAQKHNLLIRGHTLLWHRSLPFWVSRITNPTELESVIVEHITAVVGRYVGMIYAWDVVNEIFTDVGDLRENHFFKVLGERYVRLAFQAAREADRGTKLYVNDYFTAKAKILAAVVVIGRWKRDGWEIDGVGVQGHVSKGEAGRLGWSLEVLGKVVDEVAITELDVVDAGEEEYVEVVQACLNVPNCVGITSWGVRDSDSWQASMRPLLFDEVGEPKAAYHAVVKCLCVEAE